MTPTMIDASGIVEEAPSVAPCFGNGPPTISLSSAVIKHCVTAAIVYRRGPIDDTIKQMS